jgi:SulP family sulfate permease
LRPKGGSAVTWRELAPGLTQLRNYQRSWLRGDLLGGVTVAAYLIPQVMAYATVAGLPPVAGLWAAIPALVGYAVLGSSRQLSTGPESSTAVMTAAVLSPMAAGSPGHYAALAGVLAILVGALCFIGGIARLGFLANLLSKPVLVGYMSGLAVVMVASQLGKITGVDVVGEGFAAQIRSLAANLHQLHWPTIVLAASVLALLLGLARWAPRLPGALIAMLAATALVAGMSLHHHGIGVVGPIPTGLPTPTIPAVRANELALLMLPAAGIAIVAFCDTAITARSFAAHNGQGVDANADLRALGVANVAAGLLQGFPVSSSASRTALGDALGSRTQLFSWVTVACTVLGVLFGRGLLAMFPTAALGALVVYAGLRLIDIPEFVRLARFRRSELILALATTAAVLGIGVLYGVLAAVGLSILDLLRRLAHGHDSVLGFVPGLAGMHDVDDYPEARPVPGLMIYRYDAPLCFANAEDFLRRALSAVDANRVRVEWFVLNAEANVDVDLTGLDALDQLRGELARRGTVFAMARVKQDLRDSLDAVGLTEKIGQDRIFMTLPTAVEAFRHRSGA